MAETIGYQEVARMILAAAEKIRANHETLSKLDSATGDGDHGTSMVRTAAAMENGIQGDETRDLKNVLHGIGWSVMGVDGGSTGPLFGSLLMGMSEGVGEADAIDCAAVAAMFEAGLAKVRKLTKAQVGDKTMMDALVPAVEALRKAAGEKATIGDALDRAAAAAAAGAEATADMQAKFGRARNLGERTVGHVDPGATSMSYIFQGFAAGISSET